MKLDVLTPNIVRIAYHQESGDPHYGSCLWAYYDFDLDRYMLNIQSDCGNAAYRWVETPGGESFLHLMARCDDGYMMMKLFGTPELVDKDATVDEVRERLGIGNEEDYMLDLDEDERQKREDAIQELSDTMDEYGGISQDAADAILTEWANDNDMDIDCIWECVATDYSVLQYRIVQIFKDHIQPKIRELLKDGESK